LPAGRENATTNAETVLVIDDDHVVCDVVSAIAATMGLSCDVARDPSNFLDHVTPKTSLILLDLMMPGMDGIEVLRLLGEHKFGARVLLMSGMDKRVLETAEKLAQSLGLAVVGYLQKPFSPLELRSVLEAVTAMETPQAVKAAPIFSMSDEQIRKAVENGEFLNYYQPQISLKTGEVMGVEALARWRHPERGLILPESFLARLDTLGLMDKLCWNTSELAMAEARSFVRRNGELLRLSINATMRSLINLDFPDALVALAKKYDFPVEKITVEMTESRLIHEMSHTLDVLTRLRMKGFQLSIDDFGSGYAMMRQLQNVPATELKIDKSIVERMHLNNSDRVMVEKIIEMGHELKMHVVAEGVVTPEQAQMLRAKGCDGAQGYWFSHPLAGEALKSWLAAHESE
jgi:EAL domain-containing protein (putative c-di-GMP-specific phosphodiesterase class I)/CheY-like chemotaxis protein